MTISELTGGGALLLRLPCLLALPSALRTNRPRAAPRGAEGAANGHQCLISLKKSCFSDGTRIPTFNPLPVLHPSKEGRAALSSVGLSLRAGSNVRKIGSCFGMLPSQSFTVSVGDYDLIRHDPIIKKAPFLKIEKGCF